MGAVNSFDGDARPKRTSSDAGAEPVGSTIFEDEWDDFARSARRTYAELGLKLLCSSADHPIWSVWRWRKRRHGKKLIRAARALGWTEDEWKWIGSPCSGER